MQLTWLILRTNNCNGREVTPVGLEDVFKYPALKLKLLERGYSPQDVEKILKGDFMRVFEQV